MNCSDCTTQISEYHDGELPDFRKRLVRNHLQTCSECQAFADNLLTQNSEIKQAVNRIPVPAYLEEQILAAIKRERGMVRSGVGATSLVFVLLGIPVLSVFSPFLLSSLRLFFKTIAVFIHTCVTLIALVLPPVLWLEIAGVVTLLIVLGVYCLRVLLRGLHINEVLHDG